MEKYYLKLLMVIVLFLFATNEGFSQETQNPSIEWQKCIGGSNDDDASSIVQTSDGGYIAVGHTFSTDFDAVENHSISTDLFVVKFSYNGSIEWKRCLGGTGGEFYPSIKETTDGGYIVSGSTNSNDGDVSGNHGNYNGIHWGYDTWVVKLDILGNIKWQKCYGGSEYDDGSAIIQTSDGGFIITGYTMSYDGDLLNLNFYENSQQGWVVKIDSIGNIQWQKLIGGTGEDLLYSIQPTSDSGFIVAGVTSSNDGDVVGNNGVESAWVVKLSSIGSLEWQKCIGSGLHSQATDIKQCSDGGYIVACEKKILVESGMSYSHGYVIKLNALGNVEWEKQLGGYRDDFLKSILQTVDGGFIVGGSTRSLDGDLQWIPSLGLHDYWVIKLSSSGNIEWQKRFGGNNDDMLYSLTQTSDFGYILAGETKSNNNDVTGLHTSASYYDYSDMWIVKLSSSVSTDYFENVESFVIFPNPAQDYLNIQVDPTLLNQSFQLFSITGQLVLSGKITAETMTLNFGSISEGIYLFQIGNQTKKFVKIK